MIVKYITFKPAKILYDLANPIYSTAGESYGHIAYAFIRDSQYYKGCRCNPGSRYILEYDISQ